MEQCKKNNNMLTIILFILLLIAVEVICYLLGSNNSNADNKNKQNNITEENNHTNKSEEDEKVITPTNYNPKCNSENKSYLTDIDETKYNNIVEYIKEQKNVQIILSYCKSFETYEYADYTLTEDEKNSVLNEMKNSSFKISQADVGGAGVSSLKISYERNNSQYYISYWGLHIMKSNDGNIYKILDKSTNNTLSEPQLCFYGFSNLSSTAKALVNKYSA